MPGHPTAEYGKHDTGRFAAKNADLQTIAENRVITIPAPGLQIPAILRRSLDQSMNRPTGLATRRQFTAIAGSAFASLAFSGGACEKLASAYPDGGRLTARPRANISTSARRESTIRLDGSRDAILRMPPVVPTATMPLLVLLHGATGSGAGVLRRLGSLPEQAGVAVLAPDSRSSTWDVIEDGRFGADVHYIDRALEWVFERVGVDPARIAVGGFSDGATYALSLGLINGDLFSHVVAFSPGFVVQRAPRGHPRFFISHGTSDPVLPIDRCSRVIVPGLRKAGYDVIFREFNGGHEVPEAVARDGLEWLAHTAGK
jgi:phospholipase/carboxylesterase